MKTLISFRVFALCDQSPPLAGVILVFTACYEIKLINPNARAW